MACGAAPAPWPHSCTERRAPRQGSDQRGSGLYSTLLTGSGPTHGQRHPVVAPGACKRRQQQRTPAARATQPSPTATQPSGHAGAPPGPASRQSQPWASSPPAYGRTPTTSTARRNARPKLRRTSRSAAGGRARPEDRLCAGGPGPPRRRRPRRRPALRMVGQEPEGHPLAGQPAGAVRAAHPGPALLCERDHVESPAAPAAARSPRSTTPPASCSSPSSAPSWR